MSKESSTTHLIQKYIGEIKYDLIEHFGKIRSLIDLKSQEIIIYKHHNNEEKRQELLEVNEKFIEFNDKLLSNNLELLNDLLKTLNNNYDDQQFRNYLDKNDQLLSKEELKRKYIAAYCYFVPFDIIKDKYPFIVHEELIGLFLWTDWYLGSNEINYLKLKCEVGCSNLLINYDEHLFKLSQMGAIERLVRRDTKMFNQVIINFRKDDFNLLDHANVKLEFLTLLKSIQTVDVNMFSMVADNVKSLELDEIEEGVIEQTLLSDKINMLFNAASKCKNLETLNLNNCQFESLRDKNFHLLKGLKVIYLCYNNLSKLTETEFMGLENLNEIYLESNKISFIHDSSFRTLTNLTKLSLNFNDQLERINDKMFDKLVNLEELSFNECKIKHIDDNAFKNLSKLIKLDLNDNCLTNVSLNLFSGLKKLQELSLLNNLITNIEDYAFKHLTNLKKLVLDRNFLTTITRRTFNGLVNLEILLLRNKIRLIEDNSFETLNKLRKLDMVATVLNADCYCSPNIFNGLSQLLCLWIRISSIPVNNKMHIFSKLENLLYLRCKRSYIEHLDADLLYGLSKLEMLNISFCRVKSIDKDAFTHLKSLKKIYIYNNPILKTNAEQFNDIDKFKIEYNCLDNLVHLNIRGYDQDEQLDDEIEIEYQIRNPIFIA